MSLDLHECAKRGDIIQLQLILSSRSAPVTLVDRGLKATPLHYAVLEQHLEAVELLLEYRADPNVQDRDGRTAMHNVVSKQGDVETSLRIASLLLDAGGDPTVKNKEGETILHQAAKEGHLDLINYLLDERSGEIEVDCRNEKDETPLFFAAGNSHVTIVIELLERGANPNIPNMKGRTPLHMALRWAKAETKKRIERAAAMAPNIEHVTLPSGLVIRKDLLPSSFNEVISKLKTQQGPDLDRSPSPSPTRGDVSDAAYNSSFAAQVNLLGGKDPYQARRQHLSTSPQLRPESSGFLPRKDSALSSSMSRERERVADEATESVTESLHNSNVTIAKTDKRGQMRKREIERMVDKERVRVDQRLRGLFYAGFQKQSRSNKNLEVADEMPTQKEEELQQLNSEIKALKQAGFRDPVKEMRRLERETRRNARTERKMQREREREEEEMTHHEDGDAVGELSSALLHPDVASVVPAAGAFTLRKIVNGDSSAKTGMFGIINALELRLKAMNGMYSELDKYVLYNT
eukprot:TRINITY_DN11924_c0_g1_i2.p1 TRINITY_DN11924_c0_g1~~TRINITY_DN11924_c0_g1_i2.p1  ORF type:complete len:538 (+),score=153.17 TRINITY_DN11924_c0_g1_i2:52-1614(+)